MSKSFEEHQLERSDIKGFDPILNEPILNHDYDGIEELDNPLPSWWVMTFYLTIVFSAVYFYYHNVVGGGTRGQQAYMQELTAYQAAQFQKEQAQIKALDPAVLQAKIAEPATIKAGSKHYAERCAACHAVDGGGAIGPNLTDKNWLHGDGTPIAVYGVIKTGVPDKGMPPWGSIFDPDQMIEVTAYVASLKGTTAANPKAVQGKEFP